MGPAASSDTRTSTTGRRGPGESPGTTTPCKVAFEQANGSSFVTARSSIWIVRSWMLSAWHDSAGDGEGGSGGTGVHVGSVALRANSAASAGGVGTNATFNVALPVTLAPG